MPIIPATVGTRARTTVIHRAAKPAVAPRRSSSSSACAHRAGPMSRPKALWRSRGPNHRPMRYPAWSPGQGGADSHRQEHGQGQVAGPGQQSGRQQGGLPGQEQPEEHRRLQEYQHGRDRIHRPPAQLEHNLHHGIHLLCPTLGPPGRQARNHQAPTSWACTTRSAGAGHLNASLAPGLARQHQARARGDRLGGRRIRGAGERGTPQPPRKIGPCGRWRSCWGSSPALGTRLVPRRVHHPSIRCSPDGHNRGSPWERIATWKGIGHHG